MFLTTFDRKMYEEALREEGREELAQKYEELFRDHEELFRDHEELFRDHEELSRDHEELSRKHENLIRDHAVRLYENGVSYEVAKTIVTEISAEELEKIYAHTANAGMID